MLLPLSSLKSLAISQDLVFQLRIIEAALKWYFFQFRYKMIKITKKKNVGHNPHTLLWTAMIRFQFRFIFFCVTKNNFVHVSVDLIRMMSIRGRKKREIKNLIGLCAVKQIFDAKIFLLQQKVG